VALAILDIELGNASGFDLCRTLLEINPRTNIVFLTAYADYSLDAWDTEASGFLLKPLTPDGVRQQLKKLRRQVMDMRAHDEPIQSGDMGKKDSRLSDMRKSSGIQKFLKLEQFKFRLLTHYPSNVIWMPFHDLYVHFFYIKKYQKKYNLPGKKKNSNH
ncbi:MAG: response regulator, partial [Prevotella sp.]|nr:response regulator [Prevotella sp.]